MTIPEQKTLKAFFKSREDDDEGENAVLKKKKMEHPDLKLVHSGPFVNIGESWLGHLGQELCKDYFKKV